MIRSRLIRALALAGALGVAVTPAAAGAAASPAGGVGGPGPGADAKYYVSTVTAVEPAVPGLDVSVTPDGSQVTLTNRTGEPVVVLGYAGEDFLRVTESRVDRNARSLTTALGGDVARNGLPEQFSRPGQERRAPRWEQLSAGPTVTWEDFRTRWMAEQRPPVVQEDPRGEHRVFDWALQLRVGDDPVLVRGAVDWTGEPFLTGTRRTLALAGGGVVALLVVAGVLLVLGRRRLGGPDDEDGDPDADARWSELLAEGEQRERVRP